jgi:hypothetical protein
MVMSSQIKDGGAATQWIVNDAAGLDAMVSAGAVCVDRRGVAWQLAPFAHFAPELVWHRAGERETAQSGALHFPVRVLLMETRRAA